MFYANLEIALRMWTWMGRPRTKIARGRAAPTLLGKPLARKFTPRVSGLRLKRDAGRISRPKRQRDSRVSRLLASHSTAAAELTQPVSVRGTGKVNPSHIVSPVPSDGVPMWLVNVSKDVNVFIAGDIVITALRFLDEEVESCSVNPYIFHQRSGSNIRPEGRDR